MMRESPGSELGAGHSGVTLWRRIADQFEQAIASGDYGTDGRLPSETDIAERFGVNRHTVRRALAALAERGLVRSARGSGTFVASRRLTYPIGERTRFSEIVGIAGHEVGGRLLGHAVEPAGRRRRPTAGRRGGERSRPPGHPAQRRSRPGLPCGELGRGRPHARGCASVSARALHDGDARPFRHSRLPARQHQRDGGDRRRRRRGALGLSPGRPILVVDSVDVDERGVPIVTTQARFAADRVSLLVRN